jgi:hypothetical protein
MHCFARFVVDDAKGRRRSGDRENDERSQCFDEGGAERSLSR